MRLLKGWWKGEQYRDYKHGCEKSGLAADLDLRTYNELRKRYYNEVLEPTMMDCWAKVKEHIKMRGDRNGELAHAGLRVRVCARAGTTRLSLPRLGKVGPPGVRAS